MGTGPQTEGSHTVLLLRDAVLRNRDGARGPPLTLEVTAGGAHVITAGRGGGKSTALAAIALALPPRSGVVELFGRDLSRTPPSRRCHLRRRIGMIFQDLRLVETLSTRDNVALAARAAGRSRDDYEAPLREVLAWVGLARRAGTAAADLDDEGRARLAVARAVVNRPELVIADDPRGEAMLRLLSDLNGAGVAMLIATRDTELAAGSGALVTPLAVAA